MMRKPPKTTFEDLLNSTGPEWEEVPHGVSLVITEESVEAGKDRLVIRLPREAARAFRPASRRNLHASLAGTRLVVEGERPPRRVRSSKH